MGSSISSSDSDSIAVEGSSTLVAVAEKRRDDDDDDEIIPGGVYE